MPVERMLEFSKERMLELENFLLGLKDQDEDHSEEYNEIIEYLWMYFNLQN
jgi:hypothetical protein